MQIEEKPPGTPPFATPFEWIGGEDKVKALVERFYDLMDFEPAYSALRAVHRVIGVRHSWHYLKVFRVQNPPFALSLSKGFDKLSPNGDSVR